MSYRTHMGQTIGIICLMLVIAGGTTWTGYMHRQQHTLNAALFRAAAENNPHKVRLLLHEGADPNTKWRDDRSLTLFDFSKQMLGADPLESAGGHTALMLATIDGKLAVVKALVESSADVNVRDAEGQTALHLAVRSHRPENAAIVLLLAKHGANLSAQTWDGVSAWDLAARNPRTMKALKKAAAKK
ncbi:MAG: repeat, subfamily [Chthonomonadaceae bacterium]|nr:repeat, subfamily [Chthonomonadaceae bacterium]